MRLTVLTENTACREGLTAEHGLSLYIETNGRHILFDAGQSDAFARNAPLLGIDPGRVDAAILSHGHYDHGGGLERFLQINSRAPVYIHPQAFGPHYNGSGKYIGLDPALRGCGRLIPAEDGLQIGPGMTLFSQIPCPFGIRPFGLCRKEEDVFLPEDFRHEQYLLVEEAGKRILISGCSHRGIQNILAHFRPDVLIGGFHFMKLDPHGQELQDAAGYLLSRPVTYYTGHCTGEAQFRVLKETLGPRLRALSTGLILDI